MAKGSNPMQGYHRQQRQKVVQKNKAQRIKARDDTVAQTKTVSQVQEEIRNIKRRKNLQVSDQQKLQRLEKELKLVKEAEASRPKEPLYLQEHKAQPLTELDDPRKSVYFDEKMNPYGAPPPGNPRLYHKQGGGVTMDIRLAVVPGEELPPLPPPPPPPRSELQPPFARHEPRNANGKQHRAGNNVMRATADRQTPSGSSSEQLPRPVQRKATAPTEKQDHKVENGPDGVKPLVAPSLPAPSKAVQRSHRGKASVDIWASTDEVEYERRANQVDLEADDVGAAALKKTKPKKKKEPLQIYYQDRTGEVQGPFPKDQMVAWFAAGFFPPLTMAKTNRNETWIPIATLPALKPEDPTPKREESVENDIAALKQVSSVEDRIAALKADSGARAVANDDELLRARNRIAGVQTAVQCDPTDVGPPPPPLERSPDSSPYPVVDNEVFAYPMVDPDVPPPYPRMDAYGLEPPSPSIDDDSGDAPAVAQYPGEDMELPAYPVDDDIAYPADTAYPVHDGEEQDAFYPVVDSYPVIEKYSEGGAGNTPRSAQPEGSSPVYPAPVPGNNEPKKIIKVDKELIAFMPSHLQSRKRKPSAGHLATNLPKRANVAPMTRAPEDDMDKFMEEIEGLNA